ncbi:MAG: flavodoxin family protein [Thermoplasmata archaeon]|nr:MAG: flavodoxin family protein [Thermoplasmata archaeon]
MVFILGINGSYRKKETLTLLNEVLDAAKKEGAKTKLINLIDYNIHPCKACNTCIKEKFCPINDDMRKIENMLIEADGIVIGSPTYYASPPGILKNFIDRTRVLKMSGHKLKNKVFSCIVTSGLLHGGGENVIQTLHEFALAHGMLVVGACGNPISEPWHVIGTMQCDTGWRRISEDKQAINSARNLGKRMVEITGLLKFDKK